MFGIGTQEILFILAIALIILGPRKLPEIARALGKALKELQKALYQTEDAPINSFSDSEASDTKPEKDADGTGHGTSDSQKKSEPSP